MDDPIGFYAGDVNFYRYVGNRSTNIFDPLGLMDTLIYVEGDFVPVLGKTYATGVSIDSENFSYIFFRGKGRGFSFGVAVGMAIISETAGRTVDLDMNTPWGLSVTINFSDKFKDVFGIKVPKIVGAGITFGESLDSKKETREEYDKIIRDIFDIEKMKRACSK